MLEKNGEIEQEIPAEWRPVITEIVEGVRARNLGPKNVLGYEISVDVEEIADIYQSVDHYREILASLPDDTWQTSVCRWMGCYWNLLIDLFTEEEGLSDLVLFVDVYEHENSVSFNIRSLHVP